MTWGLQCKCAAMLTPLKCSQLMSALTFVWGGSWDLWRKRQGLYISLARSNGHFLWRCGVGQESKSRNVRRTLTFWMIQSSFQSPIELNDSDHEYRSAFDSFVERARRTRLPPTRSIRRSSKTRRTESSGTVLRLTPHIWWVQKKKTPSKADYRKKNSKFLTTKPTKN